MDELTIKAKEHTLPCGCSSQGNPVFWNEHNEVVQCHKCGTIYTVEAAGIKPIPEDPGRCERFLNALLEQEQEITRKNEKIAQLEQRLERSEARARRFFHKASRSVKELAQFDREVRDLVGVPLQPH